LFFKKIKLFFLLSAIINFFYFFHFFRIFSLSRRKLFVIGGFL